MTEVRDVLLTLGADFIFNGIIGDADRDDTTELRADVLARFSFALLSSEFEPLDAFWLFVRVLYSSVSISCMTVLSMYR